MKQAEGTNQVIAFFCGLAATGVFLWPYEPLDEEDGVIESKRKIAEKSAQGISLRYLTTTSICKWYACRLHARRTSCSVRLNRFPIGDNSAGVVSNDLGEATELTCTCKAVACNKALFNQTMRH